ncbi:MAG: hypothetical protein H6738_15000 [Alphaproteobacteria bacterium]|nr:hypothetical protein [Alphaproteobacteria bacterium]
MLTWLALPALALEVDPHGRWVEDVEAAAGVARAELRGGVSFPLTHEGLTVGFVYVGETSLTVPVATSGEALAIRAGLPELSLTAGERWTERGEVLLAIGLREEVLAAAMAGHPLTGAEKTIAFVDDQGRERVLVTALTPRAALERARATLRDRTRALTAARLDPSAMLGREMFRVGERRAIVELRSEHDLGPLIGAIDDSADLVRTWMTWVIDPTGLIDETRAQVVAVHGPGAEGHAFRILTGVPLAGPPAWTVHRAEVNLVLDRPVGGAALAHDQARLELEAGERGRWVDVWIPRVPSPARHGQTVVGGDPEITLASLADGTPLATMDLPFGPRRPDDRWVERSLVLPEDVAPGRTVSVRLDWQEPWDVSGVFDAKAWVSHEMQRIDPRLVHPVVPRGFPDAMTLGRVTAGVPVLPHVPGSPPHPTEVRAGTVSSFRLSVGGGAVGRAWEDGAMWVAEVDGPTTVTGGDLSELREGAVGPFPAIRLLRHAQALDPHMPERIRAILHFYATALPPWPHPEVVVIEGQARPVAVLVTSLRNPNHDPQQPPIVRWLGGGQVVVESVVALPVLNGDNKHWEVKQAFPHAAERGLAEAVAAGWFADLPWHPADAWLGGAIPKVFRDRFVEEAWGEKVASIWASYDDQNLSREAPSDGLQLLVGTDDWWADEVGARFLGRAIEARIGERALLEGFSRLATSDDPSLDRLVTELEDVSRTSLRDTFDAFVVAGLRPSLKGEWEQDGDRIRVHLVADVPLGTYEIPVVATKGKAQTTAWIRVVDGVGEGSIAVSEADDVVIDPNRVMPLRGRGSLHRSSGQG